MTQVYGIFSIMVLFSSSVWRITKNIGGSLYYLGNDGASFAKNTIPVTGLLIYFHVLSNRSTIALL